MPCSTEQYHIGCLHKSNVDIITQLECMDIGYVSYGDNLIAGPLIEKLRDEILSTSSPCKVKEVNSCCQHL